MEMSNTQIQCTKHKSNLFRFLSCKAGCVHIRHEEAGAGRVHSGGVVLLTGAVVQHDCRYPEACGLNMRCSFTPRERAKAWQFLQNYMDQTVNHRFVTKLTMNITYLSIPNNASIQMNNSSISVHQ